MKNSKYFMLSIGLCFAPATFAGSEVVVKQDHIDQSRYIVGQEETEITKEYVTALALDGMRRLFETGLDFLSKESQSTITELERKKKAIQCAFDYALISNQDAYWDPRYVQCVKETGQITGNINDDAANGGIYKNYTSESHKDPRYYKWGGRGLKGGYWDTWCIPGPLLVLEWAMSKIGKFAIDLPEQSEDETKFLSTINAIIDSIEARKHMGLKAYVADMDRLFRDLQALIDSHAKSKVNREEGILNLMNLRLTEEGASKLGQLAFEEANHAYASKPITPDNAKALALFALTSPLFSALLQKQNGEDLKDSLDEMIEAYNLIFDTYKEQSSSNKPSVRMSEKMKLAIKTLSAYYFNDMHGFSQKKVEADPLKNAFKIGRILAENAKTLEYDPANRTAARQEEQNNRIKELKQWSAPQQNPQITAGQAETSEAVALTEDGQIIQ